MKYIGNEYNNLGKDGMYDCAKYPYVGYCEYYGNLRCNLDCNYAKDKEKESNRIRNNPCFRNLAEKLK